MTQTFKIVLNADWFQRGDILTTGYGDNSRVAKKYKRTWWKSLIRKIGFKDAFRDAYRPDGYSTYKCNLLPEKLIRS